MVNQRSEYLTLQENLSTGNVAAFIGAGLSMSAGLPGWYELIRELSDRIQYPLPPKEWSTGSALIDAAQAYINQEGLHSLIAFVKRRLDSTDMQPSRAHEAFVRLPISLVFTANYDDLLERAYRNAGKRTQVIVRDSSMPYLSRDKDTVNIVKLYGDLYQEDTIVLAAQQYESFFLQRPLLIKLLETELVRLNMLYIGWSHADPHFNLIFGELLSRFGDSMRAGYGVMFDNSAAQRQEMERKHIHVVTLPSHPDRTEQLATWLRDLNSNR